ncbi:unnamed protein product [Arabidopsis halleri]
MISHEERSCPNLTEEERFKLRADRAIQARKEAEEEELFRVPQPLNRFNHFSSSDQSYRESHRKDRAYSPVELPGKHYEKNKVQFSSQERRRTESSTSLPLAHASTHRRVHDFSDPPRERYHEKRESHHSHDYHEKERDHKPVWHRLESKPSQHYPRHRETFNNLNSDYRKRHDARNHKLQRLDPGNSRDARHFLDSKRSSYPYAREDLKTSTRKASPQGTNDRVQSFYREKGKRIQYEEDGSCTITASDIRNHRSNGTAFYREKIPISPLLEKSPAPASGSKEAAATPSQAISLANPKVTPSLEKGSQKTPTKSALSKEEELQLQKDLEEMKERHLTLSAEEKKALQDQADELYTLHMQQEDVDNDDLLVDDMQDTNIQVSGEHTVSEQIKPISRLQEKPTSPSLSPSVKRDSPSPSRRPAKERIVVPNGSLSKSAHRRRRAENRRRVSQSPIELPGVASKKRNILFNGSPKKRPENKSQTLRSRSGKPATTVPRSGVFPSSSNKRTKSLSGLVGSQNPPSKNQ